MLLGTKELEYNRLSGLGFGTVGNVNIFMKTKGKTLGHFIGHEVNFILQPLLHWDISDNYNVIKRRTPHLTMPFSFFFFLGQTY